jgi:radical SAM protein with 4Fe4S-binding SPASM domain
MSTQARPSHRPAIRDHVRAPTAEDRERPHPIYCVWEITLACDLGCKHCGSRAGKARSDELSTEECLDVVHQLHEVGIREVTLIGGEAYLREDWDTIAREITRLGMLCGMTTGARSLSDERIRRAKAAGMRGFSISIDGLEETHDAQRGAKGSWQQAVDAARRVKAAGMALSVNTQINRLSMPELPAVADLLVELGVRGWQIQLTVPMGRAADRPEMLLQPYDLLELFPLLVWIRRTKLDPGGVALYPGNNIGYFGPWERLLRYGGEEGAHWQSCSAGRYTLGLEADGKIKGCPSLPSDAWTGGNFRTGRLADVLRDAPELNQLQKRTREDLWGYCRTCYYGDICKAGCTWTSYVTFGKAGNNPYCIHRATDLEARGVRERLERVAPPPGRPFDNGRFAIIEEPIPGVDDDAGPQVLDVPLAQVLASTPADRSLWTKDERRDRLHRWPRTARPPDGPAE